MKKNSFEIPSQQQGSEASKQNRVTTNGEHNMQVLFQTPPSKPNSISNQLFLDGTSGADEFASFDSMFPDETVFTDMPAQNNFSSPAGSTPPQSNSSGYNVNAAQTHDVLGVLQNSNTPLSTQIMQYILQQPIPLLQNNNTSNFTNQSQLNHPFNVQYNSNQQTGPANAPGAAMTTFTYNSRTPCEACNGTGCEHCHMNTNGYTLAQSMQIPASSHVKVPPNNLMNPLHSRSFGAGTPTTSIGQVFSSLSIESPVPSPAGTPSAQTSFPPPIYSHVQMVSEDLTDLLQEGLRKQQQQQQLQQFYEQHASTSPSPMHFTHQPGTSTPQPQGLTQNRTLAYDGTSIVLNNTIRDESNQTPTYPYIQRLKHRSNSAPSLMEVPKANMSKPISPQQPVESPDRLTPTQTLDNNTTNAVIAVTKLLRDTKRKNSGSKTRKEKSPSSPNVSPTEGRSKSKKQGKRKRLATPWSGMVTKFKIQESG